jgi:hypothetical protein
VGGKAIAATNTRNFLWQGRRVKPLSTLNYCLLFLRATKHNGISKLCNSYSRQATYKKLNNIHANLERATDYIQHTPNVIPDWASVTFSLFVAVALGGNKGLTHVRTQSAGERSESKNSTVAVKRGAVGPGLRSQFLPSWLRLYGREALDEWVWPLNSKHQYSVLAKRIGFSSTMNKM